MTVRYINVQLIINNNVHRAVTALTAAAAAGKEMKYTGLANSHIFFPVAVGT